MEFLLFIVMVPLLLLYGFVWIASIIWGIG